MTSKKLKIMTILILIFLAITDHIYATFIMYSVHCLNVIIHLILITTLELMSFYTGEIEAQRG